MSLLQIIDLDVHDPETFAEYQERFPAVLERHGGRYLTRGGHRVLSGEWDLHRVVILEFPDEAAMSALYADPDYLALAPIRERSARGRSFLVEGSATH